jgi:hypothetical protein
VSVCARIVRLWHEDPGDLLFPSNEIRSATSKGLLLQAAAQRRRRRQIQ